MERIGTYEWTVVLIGMGTVFVALVGLSLILSVFTLVSRKKAGKPAKAPAPAAAAPAKAPAVSGVAPELVAVITAAVAAASGKSARDIRIARIAPASPGVSGLNTPVWGYANRLASSGR